MHSRYLALIRTGILTMLLFLVACAVSAFAGKPQKPGSKPASEPIEYVGSKTCLSCHADKEAVMKSGPHARQYSPNAPAAEHNCEICHGSGKAHVAEASKTKSLSPNAVLPNEFSSTCADCHDRMRFELWAGSQHDNRNVGCPTCHSIHSPQSKQAMLRTKNETELCASCHRTIVNKTNRFAHMPLREGKMACASCHDMHGSANVKLLRAGVTIDESCTSCHAEKRGPFIWEHAPVADSCVTCHDSHGSSNPAMLVAKQPYICQRCHVTSRHPPAVYDGYVLKNSQNANKIYGHSCAACHSMIHGSNSPNGKAFLR